MTPAERALWSRMQRRAQSLTPELATAILDAYRTIRGATSDAELARLISRGAIDGVLDRVLRDPVLRAAMQPVRNALRAGLVDGVTAFTRDLPIANSGRVIATFDIFNTQLLPAVRRLETRVITDLSTDVRETVRAYLENTLRDGASHTRLARELRGIVSLAPNQVAAVGNYRRMLEDRDPAVLDRALRDSRYDGVIQRAFAKGGSGLTAEQIDRIAGAQQARMTAFHTDTIARTAALDTVKLSQRLTWEAATEQGLLDRGRIRRTWVGVKDNRERPEHLAMEGETVAFDQPYSNGQTVPGESDYNCRCIERIWLASAA